MAEELTLADLHDTTTKEVMAAVAEEGLLPTGKYLAKTTKVILQRNDEDSDIDPGRAVGSLAVNYMDPDNPKKKLGQGFIRVSWELRRGSNGKPDKASKNYSQLAKALGFVKDFDAADVMKAAEKALFMVRGREGYNVTDEDDLFADHADLEPFNGMWIVSLNDDDDIIRQHYLDAGYEPKFRIDSIYKAK